MESVTSIPYFAKASRPGPSNTGLRTGPAAVAAPCDIVKHFIRLGRLHPVVGGACVLLFLRADEGAVLHPRDVVDRGAVEVTAGQLFRFSLIISPVSQASARRASSCSCEPSIHTPCRAVPDSFAPQAMRGQIGFCHFIHLSCQLTFVM